MGLIWQASVLVKLCEVKSSMRLESQADFETWKIKMIMVTQVRNGKGLKENIKTKPKLGAGVYKLKYPSSNGTKNV